MKIYSKFRDFYDIGLQYGVDPHCKYIRKTEEIYRDDPRHDEIARTIGAYGGDTPSKYDNVSAYHRVLFCGKMFLCVEIYGGPEDSFFYTYDSLYRFAKARGNRDLLKDVTGVNANRFWKHKTIEQVFYNYPTDRVEQLVDISIEFGSPIIQLTTGHYRDDVVRLNPCLNNIKFVKVLDPFTAFQELSMFISGIMGGQAPPMVEISDKVRLEKHGFDKIKSFRNMK